MRSGDRVQLRYCPEHTGIITRVDGNSFRVLWDSPDRRKGQPRERSVFKATQSYLFVPEGSVETRIVEDERLDIPRELLKRFGIPET